MPEIFLKPKAPSVFRFISQYHIFFNPFFPRQVDEISHWSRQLLNFFIVEVDILITLLASIGVVNVAPMPSPSFTYLFSHWQSAIIALAIFLIVPLIVLVIELVLEAILGSVAEKESRSPMVRNITYILFLALVWGVFLGLIAALLGLGLTNKTSVIKIAFTIWAVRFFINQFSVRFIVLTVLYFARKQFGKPRGEDEEPRKCPPVLCCA